jgi:hypothetical protein
MIGKRGPSTAWVVGIHPRPDLKLDVMFAVRGQTVRLKLRRRLGKKFMKYNIVGSTGLLTWKRKKILDWRPLPVTQSTGVNAPIDLALAPAASGRAHVFISYPHGSAEDAGWVASAFKAAGVPVWVDESSIAPGDSLPTRIEEGIKGATVFVPLIDAAWIASEWCITELEIARANKVRVVPMRLEPGRFNVPPNVRQALKDVGEPLALDLRRADANQRLMNLARQFATT